MKKFLSMAAAGVFLFSACSNDEDITNGNGSEADLTGQELVLKVANTGDGLTTRASRPLYSSEAAQDIDHLKLVIFKLNDEGNAITECSFIKDYTNWNNTDATDYGTTNNGTVDHGRYASLNLKKETDLSPDGLAVGKYKVYAVGYNTVTSKFTLSAPDNTDITTVTTTPGWTNPNKFNYVTATTASTAEEIFAGEIASIEVVQDGSARNFKVGDNNVLYLHRQVAGAFGYFKNIPAAGPDGTAGKYLRLVSSAKNTQLAMTNFNSDFRATGTGVQYVVNGEASAASDAIFKAGSNAYIVYDIDLTTWFTDTPMDTDGNGVLGADDTWTRPLTGINVATKSVFASNFVIPFARPADGSTLELQLVAADNSTILRTWSIKLAAADPQVGQTAKNKNNADVGSVETATAYSFVRNHLYSIGQKAIANPTNPDTPDPSVPEEPEDLSKGQTLTLRVNDNWELIHKLVVDPE